MNRLRALLAARPGRPRPPGGRGEGGGAGPADRSLPVLRRAAGICLDYPGPRVRGALPLVRAALAEISPHPAREPLAAFAARLAAWEAGDAQEHYVRTFDTRNRRSLHLTWWSDGDTRRRGMSLVALKARYRAHGLCPDVEELPDHLPAVLEYAALRPGDGGALLAEHRGALELLRLALEEAGTPYALPVAAVCATLPGPAPRTAAEARALLRNGLAAGPAAAGAPGPPADLAGPELVGLPPYLPPG